MFAELELQRRMAATLVEIQSWPEVPAIAHFCSLFRTAFDLLEFEIEDLENALLAQDPDDMFANTLLERLVVLLLRPCLPASIAASAHEGNFSGYLRQLLENKREEAEEEGHTYDFVNPFDVRNIDNFDSLSSHDQVGIHQLTLSLILLKVRILSYLTTLRLEASDVPEQLKDLDPDGMRVEPLGEDSDGVIYWYFYGVRLYKEIKAGAKPKKPRKKKKDETSIDETGDEGGSKQAKKSKKCDEDEEEEASGPKEPPGWYLACSSEAHWNDLAAKYKKSKRKQDKELYEVLRDNFMPEIIKMFQDKEKEERIKLMMMNKRSSNRLDRKRAEKEKEFEEKRQREERMELERRVEEEKAARREKENKQKGRAERAKLREQKFLPVEMNSRLLPNRKRDREEERSGREPESRRVRGSPREVVEGDHDYTRRREEGDGVGQIQPSRRREGGNPALREWRRLTSASDEGDQGEGLVSNRNLRF